MAEEQHVADVRKYAPTVDEEAVAGIVRHKGIAARSRDASFVAATDPEEVKRVRESFLKKKLGLTQSDQELDAAVHDVLEKMKQTRDKPRVTVYYLLAERFGKLGEFHGKTAGKTKPAAPPNE